MNKEKREEGVFYPESFPHNCCEKCGDVTFEKTYPAHTPYFACMNLKCECHNSQAEKQDWKEFYKWEYTTQDAIDYWGKSKEDFIEKINCFMCCDHGDDIWKEVENIIRQAIAQSRNEPMGVSQWKEHGIKYGYWDYFEKKPIREDLTKPATNI